MKPTLPETLAAGPIELRRRREDHIDPLMDVIAASLPELAQFMPWALTMPTREAEVDFLRSDRTGRGYATAAIPPKLGYSLAAEVDHPIETPGHTGRGFVWARARD